jgi:hypothetical protein
MEKKVHQITTSSQVKYKKYLEMDEQYFDDDLLVMHPSVKRVVMLNSSSCIIWSLLSHAYSCAELVELYHQAMPHLSSTQIMTSVESVLFELLNAELIFSYA